MKTNVESPDAVTALAITSDVRYLLSGSADKSLKIFDLVEKRFLFSFDNLHEEAILTIAVTPDSKYIITGSQDTNMKIIDLEARNVTHCFEGVHKGKRKFFNCFIYPFLGAVYACLVTPDGQYIISASEDRSIKMYDFETKTLVHNFLRAHTDAIFAIAVTPNSKYLLSASADKNIKIFDLNSRKHSHTLEGAHEGIDFSCERILI